jgi:predicted AlkP superfamily pyrophosphatase or phosphodiesterase
MKYIPAFLFSFTLLFATAQTRHVVLISIDGFRPEMYRDSSWPAPNLRYLIRHGVYAHQMRSVFPSLTYPSHTAMVTGALPARSGVYFNQPKTGNGEWNWFTSSIRVPTLWRAIRAAGMTTAAVQWPLCAMDTITYTVPEIFYPRHPDDRITLTRQYSTPGLLEEIEKNCTGRLDTASMTEEYFDIDDNSARMAGYIFETRKPAFLAIHFPSVDGQEHVYGRDDDSVRLALAASDHDIGILLQAIRRSGAKDSTVVIVVGDHGMSDIHEAFRPNLLIQGIGAKFIAAGGSAFLYPTPLVDHWPPDDSLRIDPGRRKQQEDIAGKVIAALDKLPTDMRKLFRIVSRSELDGMGADSSAILALAAMPGLVFSGAVKPELFYPVHGGHHGYDPNLPVMYTGFIAAGPGIRTGARIDDLCVTDIAPLVAALLGIPFQTPDGRLVPGIIVQ